MSAATVATTRENQHTAFPFDAATLAERTELFGRHAVRYGLVAVLVWIGAMKFTAYEAEGISGLVSNSPLMSWAYNVFSTRQFAAVLGVIELLVAALIAVRPIAARVSAAGSLLAVGMFMTTLTFLVSTPGVIEPSLGFPALSVVPGQFLIKDLVLLGAAVWTAGEALRAAQRDAILRQAEILGYDPVAYFTENRPVLGRVELTAEHGGKRFHFATQHTRDQFLQAPDS